MRFMATEPWYYNGLYFEASNDKPHTFDYPDDEVPNHGWYPLDQKAHAALVKLKASSGHPFIVKAVVEDTTGLPRSEKIKKFIPEDPATALPAALQQEEQDANTMSQIQTGKRPSDVDPE